ncbi:MAG: hypothetical protein JW849_06875 [Phycisphaerae bacterium]|nr:hypothetical protein [Phycisphaerae bacterium]
MPELYSTFAQICEATMLICFGLSWPVSILKSLRTKIVHGKSAGFMWLVFFGYVVGLASKLFQAAAAGTWPEWTTPLYVINAAFVVVDISLYMRYRHNTAPAVNVS